MQFLKSVFYSVLFSAFVTQSQAEIKIGFVAPLSGPNAAFGMQLKNGAEQAIEDINAQGGSLGSHYALSIADDASDPKQGILIANRFAGEDIKAVVAHFNSGVAIPASEAYEDLGILMISPGATAAKFTDRQLSYVFRTINRDDVGAKVAAQYIAQHFKGEKIAIIHDKTPFGEGLATEVRNTIRSLGMQESLFDAINPGEKDYLSLVSRLKADKVKLLYYGGTHAEAGLIIRQMREQNLSTILMAGSGIATLEFGTIAGPAAEGTLMVFASDPHDNPDAKPIVERFKRKNINPESYTLYAYTAVQILKQAIDRAGSVQPQALAQVLRSGVPFNTILGNVNFDKKGDIDIKNIVYIWSKTPDGKIAYTPKPSSENTQ
jgi:branched-chain amino acid transport system substrate-binding protein